MAIDTTVGGANAVSYADFTEYTAYWTARLFNTVPLAASQTLAEAALTWATILLDAGFKWRGAAVDDVQRLCWPRTGVSSRNGFAVPSTSIPREIKQAECEFAGILLSGDRTADDASLKVMGSETTLSNVKVGPISLSFAGGNFTTLEAFDAYVRSLGSDFNYLSKIIPDSVRFEIPPSFYVEAQLKRPFMLKVF